MKSRDDEDHLRLAFELGRVLVSSNLGDFARLHHAWMSEGRSHAGLILIEQGRFGMGEVIRRLLLLVAIADPDDMTNRAEYLSTGG